MYKGIYLVFIRSLCIFVDILTVCYTFIHLLWYKIWVYYYFKYHPNKQTNNPNNWLYWNNDCMLLYKWTTTSELWPFWALFLIIRSVIGYSCNF